MKKKRTYSWRKEKNIMHTQNTHSQWYRNRNRNQQPVMAGISHFAFIINLTTTATITTKIARYKTHPRPVLNDICILAKQRKKIIIKERAKKTNTHTNTLTAWWKEGMQKKRIFMEMKSPFGRLFTQSVNLCKQCSLELKGWTHTQSQEKKQQQQERKKGTILNMFWKLVKHNQYYICETTHNTINKHRIYVYKSTENDRTIEMK